MLQTLKNAWKIPDLRRRILFTLMMLIVFRFGAHIPVPYLTADAMQAFLGNGGTDLFSLFDVSPSAPSDEEIDWSLRKKKKKKKRQLKL
mgnify:CR=1 FL=1